MIFKSQFEILDLRFQSKNSEARYPGALRFCSDELCERMSEGVVDSQWA